MNREYRVAVDNLIKDELDGKANAIARYDSMLWKIRSGYAVFLYGAVGIVAGLVNKGIIQLTGTLELAFGGRQCYMEVRVWYALQQLSYLPYEHKQPASGYAAQNAAFLSFGVMR